MPCWRLVQNQLKEIIAERIPCIDIDGCMNHPAKSIWLVKLEFLADLGLGRAGKGPGGRTCELWIWCNISCTVTIYWRRRVIILICFLQQVLFAQRFYMPDWCCLVTSCEHNVSLTLSVRSKAGNQVEGNVHKIYFWIQWRFPAVQSPAQNLLEGLNLSVPEHCIMHIWLCILGNKIKRYKWKLNSHSWIKCIEYEFKS